MTYQRTPAEQEAAIVRFGFDKPEWPTREVAASQVARYETAVVAAKTQLEMAEKNLAHWVGRLGEFGVES